MASDYEIDITLSPATVDALKNGGFALYAFKAVKSSVAGAAPLVWFRTTAFLSTTTVKWQEQYKAYISTDEIIANGKIQSSADCNIDLGQTAYVTQNGNISPASEGSAGAISILNQGNQPWTTGISQMTNGQANPMCAIPLYGKNMDVVVPIEKVLLTFASNTVNTGTVVYKAYAESVLVDLTGNQERSISFDINNSWSWGTGTWAQTYPANSDLVPLLITN